VVDRVAAVVNDEVIALSEIYDLGGEHIQQTCAARPVPGCEHDLEMQILDSLIMRALTGQELARLGMDVAGEEVDQAIEQIARDYEFEDRQALRAEVERSGLTWEAYREQITEQLRTMQFQQGVLAARVTVSDDEVVDAYQRVTRDQQAIPEARVEAAGYRVDDGTTQEQLGELLLTMREAASAVNAGDQTWLNVQAQFDTAGLATAFANQWFQKGQLNQKLEMVILATDPGQVSEPIIVDKMIYLVQVLETREIAADIKAYEDVEDQLREQIFERKLEEAGEEWYQIARRQAAVDIFLAAE
jgi:peptidyl-prolyl cis-trans isomerase SurA